VAAKILMKVINFERKHSRAGTKSKNLVKILSRGALTSALEIHAKGFSSAAKTAIEAAGGKAIVD